MQDGGLGGQCLGMDRPRSSKLAAMYGVCTEQWVHAVMGAQREVPGWQKTQSSRALQPAGNPGVTQGRDDHTLRRVFLWSLLFHLGSFALVLVGGRGWPIPRVHGKDAKLTTVNPWSPVQWGQLCPWLCAGNTLPTEIPTSQVSPLLLGDTLCPSASAPLFTKGNPQLLPHPEPKTASQTRPAHSCSPPAGFRGSVSGGMRGSGCSREHSPKELEFSARVQRSLPLARSFPPWHSWSPVPPSVITADLGPTCSPGDTALWAGGWGGGAAGPPLEWGASTCSSTETKPRVPVSFV